MASQPWSYQGECNRERERESDETYECRQTNCVLEIETNTQMTLHFCCCFNPCVLTGERSNTLFVLAGERSNTLSVFSGWRRVAKEKRRTVKVFITIEFCHRCSQCCVKMP